MGPWWWNSQPGAIEWRWYSYPLFVGMQLARNKHIGIHVALCTLTEVLVLLQNLPIEIADVGELLVRSILMTVDFVLDLASCRRSGYHALDVEEVVAKITLEA